MWGWVEVGFQPAEFLRQTLVYIDFVWMKGALPWQLLLDGDLASVRSQASWWVQASARSGSGT